MKVRYFWYGFIAHLCASSINQDLMGKEKYIKAVDLFWIDSSITLPFAIIILIIVLALFILGD